MTTCKRLTNSNNLPKLSLTILSLPVKRRDTKSAEDIRADVSISKRFHFLGIPGSLESIFKFDMGKP